MQMSLNKGETGVHAATARVAVRMCEVLARPWFGAGLVYLCPVL